MKFVFCFHILVALGYCQSIPIKSMKLDYSNHGASWGVDWPLCIAGLQQSPINIDTGKTTANTNLWFNLVNYKNFNNGTLITPLGGS